MSSILPFLFVFFPPLKEHLAGQKLDEETEVKKPSHWVLRAQAAEFCEVLDKGDNCVEKWLNVGLDFLSIDNVNNYF